MSDQQPNQTEQESARAQLREPSRLEESKGDLVVGPNWELQGVRTDPSSSWWSGSLLALVQLGVHPMWEGMWQVNVEGAAGYSHKRNQYLRSFRVEGSLELAQSMAIREGLRLIRSALVIAAVSLGAVPLTPTGADRSDEPAAQRPPTTQGSAP